MALMIARSCYLTQGVDGAALDHRAVLFDYRESVPDRDPKNKDRKHPDLASRILYMIDEMGWNKSDLARELDCEPSAVGNWIRRNRLMDPRYAFLLQDRHGWNARWLIEGIGPPRLETLPPRTEALIERIKRLPEDRQDALSSAFEVLLGGLSR